MCLYYSYIYSYNLGMIVGGLGCSVDEVGSNLCQPASARIDHAYKLWCTGTACVCAEEVGALSAFLYFISSLATQSGLGSEGCTHYAKMGPSLPPQLLPYTTLYTPPPPQSSSSSSIQSLSPPPPPSKAALLVSGRLRVAVADG